MEIATIGFTRKTAEEFFNTLKASELSTLVDVRAHRSSQLAGFAKEQNLPYFLRALTGMRYAVEPLLAPTDELLSDYRKGFISWDDYAAGYRKLLEQRSVESALDEDTYVAGVVLLCSEPEPIKCHRRLAAEYLAAHWEQVAIIHL